MNATKNDLLKSLLGAGRIDLDDYQMLRPLSLPRALRVLMAAGKVSKDEAKAIVNGECK